MILFQFFSQKAKKNWGGSGECPNGSGGVGKIFEVKFKKVSGGMVIRDRRVGIRQLL